MLHVYMPPERQPQPPSRRDFLRLAVGVPIGAVLGAGMQVGHDAGADLINDHTPLRPDTDVHEREAIARNCGDTPTKDCITKTNSKPDQIVYGNIATPLINHTVFGAAPSYFLDKHNRLTDSSSDPHKNTLFGDGEKRLFTRKELLAGSMIAGFLIATNRLTTRGRDTDVVPLGDVSGSLITWWMQRRLGCLASFSSGITYNIFKGLRQAGRFGR